MTKVKTASGFVCEIEESALDDMQMLDDLVAIDAGNITAFPRVITRLLGQEGRERLYDHLRAEDGRVPIEAFGAELGEIFKALQATGKKS